MKQNIGKWMMRKIVTLVMLLFIAALGSLIFDSIAQYAKMLLLITGGLLLLFISMGLVGPKKLKKKIRELLGM